MYYSFSVQGKNEVDMEVYCCVAISKLQKFKFRKKQREGENSIICRRK